MLSYAVNDKSVYGWIMLLLDDIKRKCRFSKI